MKMSRSVGCEPRLNMQIDPSEQSLRLVAPGAQRPRRGTTLDGSSEASVSTPGREEQHIAAALRSIAQSISTDLDRNPALVGLANTLLRAARSTGEPLRLAIAGQIKRGKSTLVNGLLGEAVAATGKLELTFNVNELTYHDTHRLVAHYRDGSQEQLQWSQLEELTIRNPEMLERLVRIRKLELGMPNELLRDFRLVDTPGLASVHVVDSANTVAYLGIANAAASDDTDEVLTALKRDGAQVHDDSAAEVGEADAILMMFSREVGTAELEAVDEFCHAADSEHSSEITPLRAFGVLGRCDEFWPPAPMPGGPDPMTYEPIRDVAQRIIRRSMSDPAVNRKLYVIHPVAGLVASGAVTASEDLFAALRHIAESADWEFVVRKLMVDTMQFSRSPDLPVAAEVREDLVSKFGLWGIFRACTHIREHPEISDDEVRARLLEDSGITGLRELIISHFGNRTTLIKLHRGLSEVDSAIAACRAAAHSAAHEPHRALAEVAAAVEELRLSMHSFAELDALAAWYNGQLPDGWRGDLLTVTGEHGTSVPARLGLSSDDSLATLLKVAEAKIKLWREQEGDQLRTQRAQAARTILASYERLATRVLWAQEILLATAP